MGRLRTRPGRHALLAADPDRPLQCHEAEGRVDLPHRRHRHRQGQEGPAKRLPDHAAAHRRAALPDHAVQPGDRAGPHDRQADLGARPEDRARLVVRRRPDQPRARVLAREPGRRGAVPAAALRGDAGRAADRARRRDGQALRRLRRGRRGQPARREELPRRLVPHDLAAGGGRRRGGGRLGDRRQQRGRHARRRGPRLRRAHRAACSGSGSRWKSLQMLRTRPGRPGRPTPGRS